MTFKDIGKPRKNIKETDPREIRVPVGIPVLVTNRKDGKKYGLPYYTQFPLIVISEQVQFDFDNTNLETLVNWGTEMIAKYSDTYVGLTLEREVEPDYYDSVIVTYRLWGTRLETQVEVDFRVRKAQSEKAIKEANERKEFKRLQKKFGVA